MAFYNQHSSGQTITILDNGVSIATNVTSINFTGAGHTGSAIGGAVTENFPSGGTVTVYAETVSGTINGSNVTFTVPTSISTAFALYLGNSIYQPGVDFTVSGTTITMTLAPDASLSGQPFWLSHT